jgi:hypothetical protein
MNQLDTPQQQMDAVNDYFAQAARADRRLRYEDAVHQASNEQLPEQEQSEQEQSEQEAARVPARKAA